MGHGTQEVLFFAFSFPENVDGGQLVHFARPKLSLKVPGEHESHFSYVPVKPALQRQSDMFPLPSVEVVSPGQSTHTPVMTVVALEYFPAVHF